MTTLAHRITGIGSSIFSEMTALANEYGAVNLGQGFPDFDGPEEIKRAAIHAILTDSPAYNQYAPAPGILILRQAVAEDSNSRFGGDVSADNVTITTGATEALMCACLAVINPGDEVIIFSPSYDSYAPAIRFAGGVPVEVLLRSQLNFHFYYDELRAAVTNRTKMVIVNSPHNPTGVVFSHDDLQAIADICLSHDLIALSDEVYEHLTYDGVRHLSLIEFEGMSSRTIRVSSIGKTFSLTGWKIGWAIACDELTSAIRRVHQFNVFATTTPLQHAAHFAMTSPKSPEFIATLRADLELKRNKMLLALNARGFDCLVPNGSYFILSRYANHDTIPSRQFSENLIKTKGVATIPLSPFYLDPNNAESFIRWCFCKRDETIDSALARLD